MCRAEYFPFASLLLIFVINNSSLQWNQRCSCFCAWDLTLKPNRSSTESWQSLTFIRWKSYFAASMLLRFQIVYSSSRWVNVFTQCSTPYVLDVIISPNNKCRLYVNGSLILPFEVVISIDFSSNVFSHRLIHTVYTLHFLICSLVCVCVCTCVNTYLIIAPIVTFYYTWIVLCICTSPVLT